MLDYPWWLRPSEGWGLTGLTEPRVRAEAQMIRTERASLDVSSASRGPRLHAISAPAVFVTCMVEMSRAKALLAMNAIGHCRNAVERTTPQRKKIKSKRNPLKPSGCSAANAKNCANQKEMGKQTPRSCPSVGGNAASDRDMMVITDAISAGSKG